MYHRKLHKYKEFEGQENIIFEQGELVYLKDEKCWLSPTRQKFYNKQAALEHAKVLNAFFKANDKIKRSKKNAFQNS